jgi:hypothetical protein
MAHRAVRARFFQLLLISAAGSGIFCGMQEACQNVALRGTECKRRNFPAGVIAR